MPVEIEAKMKVDDLAPVRERLRECGASFVGTYFETNTFFDTADRSLLAADKGLRTRHTHDVENDENIFTITYKGPRRHGPLKSRDEREVNVSDEAAAAALLESLGFIKMLSFQKRRESWMLDNCRIELDELPFLGLFVEIEGPGDDIVLGVRERLHLVNYALVKASYIALLTTYLQERGNHQRTVRFPQEPAATV